MGSFTDLAESPLEKKYVNVDVPYATASRNMHTTLLFQETIATPSNLTVNVCELPIKPMAPHPEFKCLNGEWVNVQRV